MVKNLNIMQQNGIVVIAANVNGNFNIPTFQLMDT